jgi:hypothetical protein
MVGVPPGWAAVGEPAEPGAHPPLWSNPSSRTQHAASVSSSCDRRRQWRPRRRNDDQFSGTRVERVAATWMSESDSCVPVTGLAAGPELVQLRSAYTPDRETACARLGRQAHPQTADRVVSRVIGSGIGRRRRHRAEAVAGGLTAGRRTSKQRSSGAAVNTAGPWANPRDPPAPLCVELRVSGHALDLTLAVTEPHSWLSLLDLMPGRTV